MPMPANDFDPARYLRHFEDCAMSEAEKIALIEALWLVAQSFADHAFGLAPAIPAAAIHARKTRKPIPKNGMLTPDTIAPGRAANDNESCPLRKGQSRP